MSVRGRLAALIELGGGFHPDLTGRENIYLQGTMLGLRHREIRRQFDSIVAFSEMEKFLHTPVKRYSSGMVVRLGFAIAAHVHPEILLIDEVLAVGDLAFQQKCFKRVSQLKEQGTTMIFISHNLEAVQKLCDRVLILKEGQILQEGQPAPLIQGYRKEILLQTLPEVLDFPVSKESGPLKILQVLLTDESGRKVELLQTGQSLRVEIHYQADRPIRRPTFRVALERLDGLLCHATTSRQNGSSPEVLMGEGEVALEYPAVNLLPNLYQIRMEVFEEANPVPLAAVRHGCFFQITSDQPEQGTVHLDHVWDLGGG